MYGRGLRATQPIIDDACEGAGVRICCVPNVRRELCIIGRVVKRLDVVGEPGVAARGLDGQA